MNLGFDFHQKKRKMNRRSYPFGRFFGRVENLAIYFWKEFYTFRDAGREDCLRSEQDHPEFPVQKEGQPRGAESPKRNN